VARARFGTDGLRGAANADLTAELALALGHAAARVLASPVFLVGRDTRRSGPFLQAALSAGLAAEGADVVDLGVLPTPGVAYCAEQRGLPAVMVSASHNPFGDNGLKLFAPGGTKLSPDVEAAVEKEIDGALGVSAPGPTGRGVGTVSPDPAATGRYRDHLAAQLGGRRLEGLRVVLDCANGAAAEVAPAVFADLGADVSTLACHPDGANINDGCGSTHPEGLAAAVVAAGADLGLAFDGDADRVVAVDHAGSVVHGDRLMALFAVDLASRDELTDNTVVVTVMTNLGFRLAMAERGIAVRETPVGDRHVLMALEADGLALGGEQSGHIVFRHRATTGDGVLSGLLLADLLARAGRSVADLTDGLMDELPQVLVNVRVTDAGRLADADAVWAAVREAEGTLGTTGRVLLRPSGTEPLVRVMVEAATADEATEVARSLAEVVDHALG